MIYNHDAFVIAQHEVAGDTEDNWIWIMPPGYDSERTHYFYLEDESPVYVIGYFRDR
jgi:hypothetical protein